MNDLIYSILNLKLWNFNIWSATDLLCFVIWRHISTAIYQSEAFFQNLQYLESLESRRKFLKRACISRVLELLRILSIFNRHLLIEISARHQQIRRSELSESLKVVPVFFRPRKEHNSVTRFQFPFSRINWTLEVSTLIWLNFFASIRHLTAF